MRMRVLALALVARALALSPPLEGVANFREVSPLLPGLYRSAELERASDADARYLLDELGVRTVVDLRNDDEIAKARRSRTRGGARLADEVAARRHLPPLRDVDGFFDAVAAGLPPAKRLEAMALLVFSGRKYDQLLYDELTRERSPRTLYTSMLKAAPRVWGEALRAATAEGAGPVIVHCAKGKDRTGVVAALAALAAGDAEETVVRSYARSAALLDAHEAAAPPAPPSDGDDAPRKRRGVDWSALRGSPPDAMSGTLEWVRKEHGSVEAYLDLIGIDADWRADLRSRAAAAATASATGAG